MAPNEVPMPIPTLAESERPDNDAGEEVGVAGPELVEVCEELCDASAVVAELEMGADDSSVVLDPWELDAVDVDGLDVTIETSPSVKRLEDSLQQLSPVCLVQHQVPEDRDGHAIIPPPPLRLSMIA